MLEQLFQQAPVGFAVIDRTKRYVRINPHLAAINGRPADDHLGRAISEVIPTAAPLLEPLLDQVFATGDPLPSFEIQAAAPTDPTVPRWWLLSLFPIRSGEDAIEFVGVTALEVTRRKNMELTVVESRERLDLATEAAGVGVWEWRLQTNEMIYSPQARRICGFDPEAPVTYEMVAAVTHPKDFPQTSAQARRALDPDVRDEAPFEYRLIQPDGTERWVLARGKAIFAEVGGLTKAVRYLGTLQDITDRKRAEMEMAETAAQLRLAIDAGRMAVWYADEAGVKANPELNEILGFPRDAYPSLEDYSKGYLPGEGERVRGAAQSAIRDRQRYFEVEYRYRRPAGDVAWLAIRGEIVRENTAAIGVVMDVTQRKSNEERLNLLAREVDHRAHNLMTVVQGIVGLTHSDDPAELKTMIEGRINSLASVHRLLSDSRWEGAELGQLLEDELQPLNTGGPGRVRFSGRAVRLEAGASQSIAMVIHELVTNALKYGALSVPQGRLSVDWALDQDLVIHWQEMDGPPVSVPIRRGLGSSVLERALSREGGSTEIEWAPAGLRCTIRVPRTSVLET